MPQVPRITRRLIESLPPSISGDRHYYVMEAGGRDSLRGFGLRVMRTTIQYVVRYRRIPYHLGRANVVPLEEARQAARTLLLQLQQSQPSQPMLAGRRKTVRELAELYLEKVVPSRNKPRTVEEYRRLWRLHLLPRFGALRLGEVTPELVLKMKHDLLDRPVAANRALQQLAAAYTFAKRLRWTTDNPADEKTVDRYREDPKRRCLEPDEYRRLGLALREAEAHALLPVRTIAAIRLLLLTGARPHEILTTEMASVELAPIPRIQRPEAKGDRPGRRPKGRTIWLGKAAIEIIRSIPRPPGCRWLIPGDHPDHPLLEIDKGWARICKMAGVAGASPKAARHAFRSAGPVAGVASEHMRELMGHATSEMTDQVYWHANSHAQARAAAVMDEHLMGMLAPDVPPADDEAARGELPV